MIRAHVFKHLPDGEIHDCGEHAFLQLPSRGDRVCLRDPITEGTTADLEVLYILHLPADVLGSSAPDLAVHVRCWFL